MYHYRPEVKAEVERLTAERDRLHALVHRRDRMRHVNGEWRWCGTRRARRRWEQAIERWNHALDAWRAVALMAANMTTPPKPKRKPAPQGTNAPTISGGWYGTATDWRAIQEQRRLARLWAADRAAGRTRSSWPEDGEP